MFSDKELDAFASEYAEAFPRFMAQKLGVTETETIPVSIVARTTNVIAGSLAFAAFMMIANSDGPDAAHEWFTSFLGDLAKNLEESLPQIGIDAKFEIRATSIRKTNESEDGRWR